MLRGVSRPPPSAGQRLWLQAPRPPPLRAFPGAAGASLLPSPGGLAGHTLAAGGAGSGVVGGSRQRGVRGLSVSAYVSVYVCVSYVCVICACEEELRVMSKILRFLCHAPSASLHRQQRPLLGLKFNPLCDLILMEAKGGSPLTQAYRKNFLALKHSEMRVPLVNNLLVCRSS